MTKAPKPHEVSNDDLKGLPSQMWTKKPDQLTYRDKAIFGMLKTLGGMTCDLVTQVLNNTHIENHQTFLDVVDKYERGQKPLITSMNHLHYLDDPLILVPLINKSYLDSYKILIGDETELNNWKWTPAEKRNFFYNSNPVLRKIFRDFFGRTMTVPILRGKGLDQDAFVALKEKLLYGDWVHIFGEGTRTREYGKLGPFKAGIGALVKSSPDAIVLPMGHDGMQDVSPYGCAAEILDENGRPTEKILRVGQRIQVVVGNPMNLEQMAKEVGDDHEGYMKIANVIRDEVEKCLLRAIEINSNLKRSARVVVPPQFNFSYQPDQQKGHNGRKDGQPQPEPPRKEEVLPA